MDRGNWVVEGMGQGTELGIRHGQSMGGVRRLNKSQKISVGAWEDITEIGQRCGTREAPGLIWRWPWLRLVDMENMEPEMANSTNQSGFLWEGVWHQTIHKAFDSNYLLHTRCSGMQRGLRECPTNETYRLVTPDTINDTMLWLQRGNYHDCHVRGSSSSSWQKQMKKNQILADLRESWGRVRGRIRGVAGLKDTTWIPREPPNLSTCRITELNTQPKSMYDLEQGTARLCSSYAANSSSGFPNNWNLDQLWPRLLPACLCIYFP